MRVYVVLATAMLTVGLVALSFGADPKPKPPPLVTVVLTEGSPVKGQFVSADPQNVTIQPVGKPNETPQPVVIPWGKIKSFSNGLTREKALVEFKTTNVTKLCDTCHGDGQIYCPTCHGTGHDPASSADCKTCKGEGLIQCKTPQCKDGMIPCPNTCLKDDGKWQSGHGHDKIKVFPGGGWVSSAHIGQLMVFENGRFQGANGICPTCGGKTVVDDPACENSKIPCPTCKSKKDAATCTAGCDHGMVECATCKGTGLKA